MTLLTLGPLGLSALEAAQAEPDWSVVDARFVTPLDEAAVLEAAVVARPDPTWGETPCAFVTLRPGMAATEAEIIAFCRDHMARFKAPRTVVFGPLPKTSTGKMQKFVLRDQARSLGG